ncbi:capsular associated [Fusarium beomiforme]|uniref:Capsular associated n=1 Tax=Fusarium beomiforme TaxID=44412 RepID=A0A9P5AE22_9HYPO|nr:capsular associated [Fusarium beomiforme]
MAGDTVVQLFALWRKWGFPPAEDPDDPWRSCFDDLIDWFSGPRAMLTMAVSSLILFSTGTYYATSQTTRSTYYCFELLESRRSTLALQCMGLMLDAIIVILLWRLLAWSRTAKLRLRTLGTVLTLSSISMGLVWVGSRLFRGSSVLHAGFGFLYGFDIIVDSVAFAALMISATFWVCETSPLTPCAIITFLVGTAKVCKNIYSYGDYLHPTRLHEITPLYFIAFGMITFTYTQGIESVIFIRRFVLMALLVGFVVGTTVFIAKSDPQSFNRHPVSDFIYRANIRQDRWMLEASTSGSLTVAHKIYKERHDGRDPPPAFADWYELAKGTVVIDKFDQIDQDLAPFKAIPPNKLRQRASTLSQMPGIHTIGIKDGKASRLPEITGRDAEVLDSLVATINKFAKFLPDMLFPVNLEATPRILPSWETANGHSRADLTPIVNLISKRAVEEDNADEVKNIKSTETPVPAPLPALPDYPKTEQLSRISPANYRQMQVEACPPGSRTRTSPHWNIGEFCAECVRRHSKAQLMVNWQRSLQYCSQPDLKYLHGMSLSTPHAEPIRDLLPLFGFSKSEPFQDILIPLPQPDDDTADIGWKFDRRYDAMFWRGQTDNAVISDQALRGNHKFRLLHMLGNQNPEDKVSMVLPTAKEPSVYQHEKVPITEANLVLPSSVGMNNYTGCMGPNCEFLRQLYPIVTEAQDQEPLEYRYILLLDKDNGPSPDLLRVLRSKSVPLISTIFRLHTTLTYFTGTQKKAYLNGRDTDMKGLAKDGEWIAQQGAKWANQALGERDKEVYLFRLLLEWGRLVDDKRDEIGTSKDDKGELKSSPWTKNQKW